MFRDLSQGLPVEADHIVGDMVRRAATLGVDATYLRVAYAHLQVYQAQRGGLTRPRRRCRCRRPAHCSHAPRAVRGAAGGAFAGIGARIAKNSSVPVGFPIDSTE